MHPAGRCAGALTWTDGRWFPNLVSSAGERSGNQPAAVGFKIAGHLVRKRVEIQVGPPVTVEDGLQVPFSWKPTCPAGLFPTLTGRLVLSRLGPEETRLTVSGTYQPTIGALGRKLDEALMHSAAEATFRNLVESIAAKLERALVAG